MKNILKKKEGITLIALVITIIVLLLLAGVSITMLSGQDGILSKASQTKQLTNESEEYDKMTLAVQEALVNGYGKIDLAEDSTEKNSLKEALKKTFGENKIPNYEEGKIKLSNGDTYNVTTTGSIEKAITFSKTGSLTVGIEVTASNGEKFYVIGFSDDNTKVNLLAKYNLKVDGSSQDTTGAHNPCTFCSETAWAEANVGVGDNLNNKQSIKSETTSAVGKAIAYGNRLGAVGRLMTFEEIKDLGAEDGYTSQCNTNGYSFVNSQNYNLGTAYNSSSVYAVYGEVALYRND